MSKIRMKMFGFRTEISVYEKVRLSAHAKIRTFQFWTSTVMLNQSIKCKRSFPQTYYITMDSSQIYQNWGAMLLLWIWPSFTHEFFSRQWFLLYKKITTKNLWCYFDNIGSELKINILGLLWVVCLFSEFMPEGVPWSAFKIVQRKKGKKNP